MRKLTLLVLFLASLASHARAASVTYSAAIDTSTLAGTTGSLDFNFEPGPFGSQPATLQISRFGGDGRPSGPATLTGDAGGSLPSDLQFDNGTGYNDYFQAFTFGSLLSFDIVLDGPAVGSADAGGSGSTFAFSIFSDTDGTMPALTSNTTDGYAITVDINADGSTTLRNYTQSPTSVTPEVPTGTLLATATILAYGSRRWRTRTRKTVLFKCGESGTVQTVAVRCAASEHLSPEPCSRVFFRPEESRQRRRENDRARSVRGQ